MNTSGAGALTLTLSVHSLQTVENLLDEVAWYDKGTPP